MAGNEFEDFGSESIPTRRFHHTIKLEGKKMKRQETDSNDLIVVTGSTGSFKNDESEKHCVFLSFENVRDFDSIEEKCCAAEGIKSVGWFKIILNSAFFTGLIGCIFNTMTNVGVAVLCCGIVCVLAWDSFKRSSWSFFSTRVIKWTLDEFSEEISGYFITSPTIHDKSGKWRLVLRQVSDEEVDFGLIATEIAEDSEDVVANIEISTKIVGRDTNPGMNDIIKFVHKFECEGDCGYSTPTSLSYEQLKNHNLEIKCRIQFKRTEYSFVTILLESLKSIFVELEPLKHGLMDRKGPYCLAAKMSESGIILSETKFQSKSLVGPLPVILTGTELEGDAVSFMKHPETKVFVWKIPNFSKHLKNMEFWEIFSPELLVSSHGFCSIWRLQLVELDGVFRILMKLRGLPRGISKIKMRYLLELMDNSGEFITPNNCVSTIKYPEHLNLNDASGWLPLYRRGAILERFLDKDDALNLRISLHCEPKDSLDFVRSNVSFNRERALLYGFVCLTVGFVVCCWADTI